MARALEFEKIKKIRELDEEGIKRKDIAKRLGTTQPTVRKYAEMDEEEIRRIKEKQMDKEAADNRKAETKVQNIVKEQIHKENIKNVRKTLKYGKEALELKEKIEKMKGVVFEEDEFKEIIKKALVSYMVWGSKIEGIMEKLKKRKKKIKSLKEKYSPEAKKLRRANMYQNMFLSYLMIGKRPPEELVKGTMSCL